MPADSDHATAKTKWVGYSKQSKRSILPQELGTQDFAMYHLRFIFAADLCQAFSKFGGVGPQLAHLPKKLHIGIAESVGASMSYHRIAGAKLQEKDRDRATLAADFAACLDSEHFAFTEQAKKEMALAIEAGHKKQDSARDPKAKGKGRQGDKNGQPFQPRRNAARFDATRNADAYRSPGPDRGEASHRQRSRSLTPRGANATRMGQNQNFQHRANPNKNQNQNRNARQPFRRQQNNHQQEI